MVQYGRYRVTAMVIDGKTKYGVKVGDQLLSTHSKIGDAVKRAMALDKAEKQGKKFAKASAKAGIFVGKKIFRYLTEEEKPKKKRRKIKRRKTKRRK